MVNTIDLKSIAEKLAGSSPVVPKIAYNLNGRVYEWYSCGDSSNLSRRIYK
jgi:hypothetical protein